MTPDRKSVTAEEVIKSLASDLTEKARRLAEQKAFGPAGILANVASDMVKKEPATPTTKPEPPASEPE